jgi:hypothetical protein
MLPPNDGDQIATGRRSRRGPVKATERRGRVYISIVQTTPTGVAWKRNITVETTDAAEFGVYKLAQRDAGIRAKFQSATFTAAVLAQCLLAPGAFQEHLVNNHAKG